jgi:hypothetical protein
MLVHFFCLLEFKFRFEFLLCLNPFQNLNPKSLNYLPLSYLLSPTQPKACAAARLRTGPAQLASRPPHPPRVPARLAFRPSWPSSRAPPQPPAPVMLTKGACWSSPSPVVPDPDTGAPPLRSPAPVRLEAWPARLGAPPGLFKAAAAPGPPTQATSAAVCPSRKPPEP